MLASLPTPQSYAAWTDESVEHPGGILVATDASPESDGALRAASAIAARSGLAVSVLAVHAPIAIAAVEVQVPATPDMEADARAALAQQVHDQLGRLGGSGWRMWTISGEPGLAIANVADAMRASLVIMGLGGHSLFDRLLGDETALRVLRLGRTPVLAVAPSFTELPKTVLAAVDFSASSGNALGIAARLVAPGGSLTVAHVLSAESDSANWRSANAAYRGSVGRAIDRMIAEAGVDPGVTVLRKVLSGDPQRTLLQLCADEAPDLVVTGSHGHNFLTRLRLGSVSTRLLRTCNRTILVAPPDDAPGYLEEMPDERGRFAFYEWAERLEEFTRRNAGRAATLEVIDPDLGAQVEEVGLPFVGAAFDPYDARVQLMFGNDRSVHLSRNIPGVTAVQLLRDRMGRDRILRVAHGRGQTLMTLER
jgi:universal stress protein E